MLPFDIINIICEHLYDLKDVVNLYDLNTIFQKNIVIKNLYIIPSKYLSKINQKIIEQSKFKHIEQLCLCYNISVSDIGCLKNTLKKLDCGGDSLLSQNSILELKIVELDVSHNKKIYDVNHLKNTLKILNCTGFNCGIDDNGISELKLDKLYSNGNYKVTPIFDKDKYTILLKLHDLENKGIILSQHYDMSSDLFDMKCEYKIQYNRYTKKRESVAIQNCVMLAGIIFEKYIFPKRDAPK